MTDNTILVTGGAGYIGSHVTRQLRDRGDRVVVLDNLSSGHREAVIDTPLVIGDMADMELVGRIIKEHHVNEVIHFAAHTVVPESVTNPLKYYGNNTCATRNLLQACVDNGVAHFIFSSTAAVYGIPDQHMVDENTPTRPINPYGSSKLVTEWALRDLDHADLLRYAALRYFNVAGCAPDGRIGQSTPNATLLIKVAAEVATGKRDSISIFGTDYDTIDGTGVRDYIHVEDLADAHLKALDHLRAGNDSFTANCGYGHGYSVRQVLDMVAKVMQRTINVLEAPRRPGDPPALIAKAEYIRGLLGWEPRYDNLEFIVRTALDWERNKRY
ncbi:MAG: UDP-glucose 4-epimerase GalE [Gammaproteobacteria bacterium]